MLDSQENSAQHPNVEEVEAFFEKTASSGLVDLDTATLAKNPADLGGIDLAEIDVETAAASSAVVFADPGFDVSAAEGLVFQITRMRKTADPAAVLGM
jgi:hypothetical protein